MFRAASCLIAAVLLLMQENSDAHHSFAAEFTAEDPMTIVGVVTEVWFRNPHARFYIDVETDSGEIEKWDTRGGSPSLMTRRGWTKDRISVGDRITLRGHRAQQADRKLLSIIWVELADGTRLE